MRFIPTLTSLTMAMGLASAAPQTSTASKIFKRSPQPDFVGGKYVVDRQAQFNNHALFTFNSGIPSGLRVSTWANDELHQWKAANAYVKNGYLELLVKGGQTQTPYIGGEVATVVDNIKYASVRTVAILSEPAGVCNGMFFYKSGTQETDIEWLSDPASLSNQGTRKLWLTNQDTDGNGKTYLAITPPSNPTSTEHEYRLDWTQGRVQWYVDGAKVWETTSDVPSQAGPWVFNNWSNGDNGWSAGPPAADAVFKIKSIEMFYNTA